MKREGRLGKILSPPFDSSVRTPVGVASHGAGCGSRSSLKSLLMSPMSPESTERVNLLYPGEMFYFGTLIRLK